MNTTEKQRAMEKRLGDSNAMYLGRILTVIDASLSDERQAKATKDLVKQLMWEYLQDQFGDFRCLLQEFSQKQLTQNDEIIKKS